MSQKEGAEFESMSAEEQQAEVRSARAFCKENINDPAYRERLAQATKTMKADDDYRERLAKVVGEAIEAVKSGYYPAPLSSLYLLLLDGDDTGRSILLPVLEGAAESDQDERPPMPGSSYMHKMYSEAIADDNGYVQTKVEFLAMQRKYGTPAEAVPSLVDSLVLGGTLKADDAPRMSLVWSAWLRPLTWTSLSGRLIYDHTVGNIARRFQSVEADLLRVENYFFYHPEHPDFLGDIGYDEYDEEGEEGGEETARMSRAMRDCFVRVWHKDDAETRHSDLLTLVDEAFQKTTLCCLFADSDPEALLVLDDLFLEKQKRSDEVMKNKGPG